ncbi:MAG: hypothetical protein ABI039_13605 [Vicinamibacterales bacterium]
MHSGQSRIRALVAGVIVAAFAAITFGSGAPAHAAALIPTAIHANNPVVQPGGNQLVPLEVNARLTANGRPLAGKVVYFASSDGRPEYCHDTTDNAGFAHCNFPFSMVRALKEQGYRAYFRGDTVYAASFDTIDLLLLVELP